MSASFAFVMVEMRRKPEIDNLTTALLTSVVTVILIAPFATFADITPLDALVLFLFGFTSNILGFFCFIAGVRRMPPAEAGRDRRRSRSCSRRSGCGSPSQRTQAAQP